MKRERTLKKYFPNGREDIDKYFIVDEENQKVWNRKTGNELSFYKDSDGYLRFSIRINGKGVYIKVHQFFYYYKHNELPNKIDHSNQIKSDYSIENLRPATDRQNNINSCYEKKVNTHLPKNIYQVKDKKTLFVRIAGQYIGCSTSLEEAIRIRNQGYKKVYSEEDLKFLPKDEFYVD
ncbi:MAG: hypothetical protein EBU90_26450 [Proteobacteria bacterium]|nr:hypothetical protein [Pseudomonadota bacterium]